MYLSTENIMNAQVPVTVLSTQSHRVVNSALLSSISDLPTHSLDHLTDNKHFGSHLSKHICADDNNDYVLEYCLSQDVSFLRTDHSLPFPQHLKQCLLGKSRCSLFFFYCMNNEITLRVLLDYGLMLSASFQQEDANKLPLLHLVQLPPWGERNPSIFNFFFKKGSYD